VRMEEVGEDDDGVTGDSRTTMKCSRCTKKGHVVAKCTAELYCVICNTHNEHMNHKCPILKMPRPVAHAVGYAVHGLGFFHIPHPPLSRARKDSKMALIKVEGGQLDKDQVIAQLQRLFGGKWKWEVTEQDVSFITKFPTKNDLQRAVAFGGADVKEEGVMMGIRMSFEMWHEKKEGYLLPKVWVRVYGMREELREFLELWAVGSMLGSTQTVDMEMTRKSDFGRVFVAVLNPLLIPARLDVVVGDHYFELEFAVERKGVDENGEEAEFNWTGGIEEEEEVQEDPRFGREAKRLRFNADSNESKEKIQINEEWDLDGLKDLVQNMSREEFSNFLEAQAKQILGVAVHNNIVAAANKVRGEGDNDLEMGDVGEKEGDGSKGVLTENEKRREMSGEAAIPEALLTPTRSSPRLAQSVDERTLSKAERRVAEKNLEVEGHL
ncbi:unnamed protein product, partial [Urochloa humidicola]